MKQHTPNILFSGLLFSFMICFLPFWQGGAHPTSLFIIHTLLFALLIMLGYQVMRGTVTAIALPSAILLFLPFLFYLLLRCCISPYYFASLLSFWEVLIFFFLTFITYHSSKNEHFAKWLFYSFLLSFSIQFFLALLFFFTEGTKRAVVYFVNPNHFAAYLTMGFFLMAPLLLVRLNARKKAILLKGIIGLAIILLLIAMALGRSRGSILSFLLVVPVFFLLLRKRMTKREKLSILLIALLILLVGAFLIYDRLGQDKDIYQYERLRIWQASLDLFSENYLFGVGPGIFEYKAGDHQFPQLQSLIRYGRQFSTPHNDYLLLLTESGLIGLVLFLIPLAFGIWMLFGKTHNDPRGESHLLEFAFPLKESIACALLVLLVQGFFDNLTDSPALYMSASILFGMMLSRLNGKSERILLLSKISKSWLLFGVLALSMIYVYYFAVLSPYVADRLFHKARVLKGQDKIEEAIRFCSRAIFFNKIQPEFYSFRGEHYLQMIENEGFHPDIYIMCQKDLSRASQLNREKALYPLNEARLYREIFLQGISVEESFQKAISLYHEAKDREGLDPFIPFECASLSFMAKDYDHALEELKDSLAVEPYFLQAQLFSAEIFRIMGRERKARQTIGNLKDKFLALGEYRVPNRYELNLLNYDRKSYQKICQELSIEPETVKE